MIERIGYGREALVGLLDTARASRNRYMYRWWYARARLREERQRSEAIQRQLDVAIREIETLRGKR